MKRKESSGEDIAHENLSNESGIGITEVPQTDFRASEVRKTLEDEKFKVHLHTLSTSIKIDKETANKCVRMRSYFLLYSSVILISFLLQRYSQAKTILFDMKSILKHERANLHKRKRKSSVLSEDDTEDPLLNLQQYLKNFKEVTDDLMKAPEEPETDSEDENKNEES